MKVLHAFYILGTLLALKVLGYLDLNSCNGYHMAHEV